MYPTKQEFEEQLKKRPIDWIIDNHLFNGTPFYSMNQPDVHARMMSAVSDGLQIPQGDICVVGSARVGFSLSPNKFGEQFNQFSDIDVLVVSTSIFDESWLDMLSYRRKGKAVLRSSTKRRLKDHREKHFVYKGWIYPDSVVEVLEIGHQWLRTFSGLSRIPELSSRSITARLYRTWDHAKIYHRWSLRQVKRIHFN